MADPRKPPTQPEAEVPGNLQGWEETVRKERQGGDGNEGSSI